MKISYQVATPDVKLSPAVTSYQGELEHSFRRLKETGYEGAELMVRDPIKLDIEEIKFLKEKYELEIPMICTGEIFGQDGLCFSDTDDEKRSEAIARTKAAVDLAGQLGAQVNVGRLKGGYMFGKPDEECIDRSIRAMKEIAAYGEKHGVMVAIEPVNPIASNFINTTQEGIELLKKIDEPYCSLMLDSNHMFISDKSIQESIEAAKGQFTYVHVADSNRLYPGNCKFNFKEFIGYLKKVGYNGWISVEVFQRPDQDTALEKSISFLKDIV